jgi:hypothetical protein
MSGILKRMIGGDLAALTADPLGEFDRRALGPDDLAGTKVAKGDLVIFCPYAIHRLPEVVLPTSWKRLFVPTRLC